MFKQQYLFFIIYVFSATSSANSTILFETNNNQDAVMENLNRMTQYETRVKHSSQERPVLIQQKNKVIKTEESAHKEIIASESLSTQVGETNSSQVSAVSALLRSMPLTDKQKLLLIKVLMEE
ncbi:hypothetical protein L0B53_03995 [Vibrio sp. SS-MA-C1-2]|uniref:hypothetical protein n=1 Tax=Vibrio sp. SS-MA-C1-2 TaxID=2908646 RepID=UPI001F2ADFBA|nr:hypothetical protein [Vibrio sp. SS-MA-C1-2]UJF17091.1 hypothetical protein L0B53_03995 [Vibrio sp. SS-MA-C1-2]